MRVFRTCRELGIETVAVVAAPDDAGSLHARSADQVVEIASYLHAEEHIRAAMSRRSRRDPPRLRVPRRERRFRGGGRGSRADVDRAAAGRIACRRRQARREADRAGGGGARAPGRRPRDGRVSAARQGGRGRRRTRHAGRPQRGRSSTRPEEAARARGRRARSATDRSTSSATSNARATSRCSCSPTRTGTSSRSASATARSSDAIRRCSRRPRRPGSTQALRATLLRGGRRVRSRHRLPQRRHGRVRPRRRGVLLPRAERPHPGRAPGDRGRDRHRPRRVADPDRRGRSHCNGLSRARRRTRGRSSPVCGGFRTFLPQAGRIERRLPSDNLSRGPRRCASTQASRRATRSGSPTTR